MKENEIDKQGQKINAFTALRVAAVYLIFVSHTYLHNYDIFAVGVKAFIFSVPAWACIWVLFTLSGYLAGRTFAGKYSRAGGAGRYYYRKVTRIWFPAVLFVLLFSTLCRPNFISDNPNVLWEYMLFAYRGTTGEFTAMWYAFTVMALYILTPPAIFLIKKISVKKRYILGFLVISLGLLYRVSTYQPIFSLEDYFRRVYYPLYGAADLYFFGMVFGYCAEDRERKRVRRICSTAFLTLCFLFGFAAVYLYSTGRPWLYTTLYAYLGPTLLSVATVFFLVSHDETKRSMFPEAIRKGLNWLSKYSFEFYMIHSSVLTQIAPYIQTGHPITRHILIILYVFTISMILSVMFHQFTERFTKCTDQALSKVFSPTGSLYCEKKLVAFYGAICFLLFIVFLIFT